MNATPLEALTLARFSQLLRTRFRVVGEAQAPVELELARATAGGTIAEGGPQMVQYESFSLVFHGPCTQPLPQGTYRFEHAQLGAFDLFIVPVAAEQESVHYEAVFSRLVKPA